jgi:hypothetical protein
VYIIPPVPYHKITMDRYKVYTHLVNVRHYSVLSDTPNNAKQLVKSIVKKQSRQNPVITFDREYVRIKKIERIKE